MGFKMLKMRTTTLPVAEIIATYHTFYTYTLFHVRNKLYFCPIYWFLSYPISNLPSLFFCWDYIFAVRPAPEDFVVVHWDIRLFWKIPSNHCIYTPIIVCTDIGNPDIRWGWWSRWIWNLKKNKNILRSKLSSGR